MRNYANINFGGVKLILYSHSEIYPAHSTPRPLKNSANTPRVKASSKNEVITAALYFLPPSRFLLTSSNNFKIFTDFGEVHFIIILAHS